MQNAIDLTKSIDFATVKKIFGNKENAIIFLTAVDSKKYYGTKLRKMKADILYSEIEKVWSYKTALSIIRNMFKTTTKYNNGKEGGKSIKILLDEWQKLGFGRVEWPFSQGAFDAFVQSINSETADRQAKDEKVKNAAVKYRRIKEINTIRNDLIETLIFENNKNLIPTLSHTKGVDFFINGVSYDQKVAKSPTAEFKRDFGVNWKKEAIKNPLKVAEYLYTYQDEGRFGAEPRLLVVYLDENVMPSRVEEIVSKLDLSQPIELSFDFNHKDTGKKSYKTFCFVVLLYNQYEID